MNKERLDEWDEQSRQVYLDTRKQIRDARRKDLVKRLTVLLHNYRIPQEHTDIILALVRRATQ